MLGIYRNAHDEQIPKLSLGVQFDKEFMENTSEMGGWVGGWPRIHGEYIRDVLLQTKLHSVQLGVLMAKVIKTTLELAVM